MSDGLRVQVDADGTLDDFMALDVAMVHFEALDDSQWYATVQLADGDVWQLNFGATNPRAKGYARAEPVGGSYATREEVEAAVELAVQQWRGTLDYLADK